MELSLKKNNTIPKVSIGMPVYNGEEFLRKKMDSLLSQTFTDFELIISDNASTDSTPLICKEYLQKDKRIRYTKQEKNMGVIWNFNFVLQQARGRYFLWTAADDIILPHFLEKNVIVLETKKNFVGSISKLRINRDFQDPFEKEKKILKKMGLVFRPLDRSPIIGTYEERIRSYLKKLPWHMIYAIFRTDKLRDSVVHKSFVGNDAAVVLNILKFGDMNVVDDELMLVSPKGMSSKGISHLARMFNRNFLGLIFPFYPLTVWCAKQLGMSLFMKNLDYFIRLNFDGEFILFVDLVRWFKKIKR